MVLIDHSSFPHILDTIAASSNGSALVALWSTCRSLQRICNVRFANLARHAVIGTKNVLHTPCGLALTEDDYDRIRTLDVNDADALSSFRRCWAARLLRNLDTMRYLPGAHGAKGGRVPFEGPLRPARLVVFADCSLITPERPPMASWRSREEEAVVVPSSTRRLVVNLSRWDSGGIFRISQDPSSGLEQVVVVVGSAPEMTQDYSAAAISRLTKALWGLTINPYRTKHVFVNVPAALDRAKLLSYNRSDLFHYAVHGLCDRKRIEEYLDQVKFISWEEYCRRTDDVALETRVDLGL